MKQILNLLSLIIILNISSNTLAQGEAALPFLYLNPSPLSNGLGWTGVSRPNDDAFGFYYNPAMLGYFSQQNNLSFQTYPGSMDWIFDIKYNSYALSAGYNFKKELNGLNLSAGAGFIHSKMDFGNFISPIGAYRSYDSFDAYSFGVALDYYITIAFGMTFKNIESLLGVSSISSVAVIEPLKANAFDYGLLLTLPVTDLFDEYNIELPNNSKLIPGFNYTLGYSRLNIGDEIYYVDPAQSDPLPLTARLGHTLSFFVDYKTKDVLINMVSYDLILEANDVLIDRDTIGFSYQGLFGDIDFGKHLIQLKEDNKVIVHKGHSISLGETVTFLIGSFAGRGYSYSDGVKTNGTIVSSRGFLKWLAAISEDNTLKFIANHIELKYISSTIFDGESTETDFSGLSVSFFNFAFN